MRPPSFCVHQLALTAYDTCCAAHAHSHRNCKSLSLTCSRMRHNSIISGFAARRPPSFVLLIVVG